ncbi:MAG: IMP dehydrogenase, partial [Gemmatimonadetes bacterium]|nr:IMP dehydrogenase [Gemmatimonadota bacterium]
MSDRSATPSLEPEFVGRTYDDFLFRPARGVVESRRDVALTLPLAAGIELELPVVSANMDSVTGGAMAKAIALEGGLGFIHRGLSIEAQVRELQAVKRSHGYVVEEPFRLPRAARVREARELMRRQGTSLLVEEEAGSGILAGLLSSRDLPWFEGYEDRAVEEIMTPFDELETRSPDVGLEEAERVLFEHRIEKLPLVDGERRIHGLVTKRDVILHRHRPGVSKDRKGRLLAGVAVGATGDFVERARALVEAGADVVLIDIAHGHSEVMGRAIERFRSALPDVPLVCGNVGTGEGARFLVERGADAVKVGIGPGRGCRTRLETAAGVP